MLAKAIYAYFCTYAGNGYRAYPKRDKIVRDLKINKDTYTKHLGTLITEDYIAKERTASGNLYTIMRIHWDETQSVKWYVKASLRNVIAYQELQKQSPTSP
jgi:hypothetical protein